MAPAFLGECPRLREANPPVVIAAFRQKQYVARPRRRSYLGLARMDAARSAQGPRPWCWPRPHPRWPPGPPQSRPPSAMKPPPFVSPARGTISFALARLFLFPIPCRPPGPLTRLPRDGGASSPSFADGGTPLPLTTAPASSPARWPETRSARARASQPRQRASPPRPPCTRRLLCPSRPFRRPLSRLRLRPSQPGDPSSPETAPSCRNPSPL